MTVWGCTHGSYTMELIHDGDWHYTLKRMGRLIHHFVFVGTEEEARAWAAEVSADMIDQIDNGTL